MHTLKKILFHPLFIAFLFSVIVISGEEMGGLYLLYLLLGLSHLAVHSVFGVVGLVLLFISGYTKGRRILNVIAVACSIISLLYFFMQPGGSYNYNGFHEFLPLLSMICFCVVAICFLFKNIMTDTEQH